MQYSLSIDCSRLDCAMNDVPDLDKNFDKTKRKTINQL